MNWARTRAWFPVTQELAYLNHAGVAPISTRVEEAVRRFLTECTARGALQYNRFYDAEIERVRGLAAQLIGADADEIAFVKNTTEGLGLVATGGHNLLEPAIQAKPVLFGPSTENFAALAADMTRTGGGIRVSDAEGLAREIGTLLDDPKHLEETGQRAFEVARRDAAAGRRTARLLRQLVLTTATDDTRGST